MESDYVNNVGSESVAESLVDTEFGGLKSGEYNVFNVYKDKGLVAKDMIRDMAYRGYYRQQKGAKRRKDQIEGLIMSDEQQQVGALSIGPALSTLFAELSLIEDDRAFFDALLQSAVEDEDARGGKKDELTVFNVIQNSITKLIEECYEKDGEKTIITFEASPFYSESDDNSQDADSVKWPMTTETFVVKVIKDKEERFEKHTCEVGGYLDTASWVFVVTKLARKFLKRVNAVSVEDNGLYLLTYSDKWEKSTAISSLDFITTTSSVVAVLNDLYMASLRFACRCIVYDEEGKYSGWMFTKCKDSDTPTYEPNLYLSYAASTIYLSLYKEYADPIENFKQLENKNVLDELRLMESLLDVASTLYEYKNICKKHNIYKEDYFTHLYNRQGILELKAFFADLREPLESYQADLNEKLNVGITNPAMKKTIKDVYQEVRYFLEYLDLQDAKSSNAYGGLEFLFKAINGGKTLTKGETRTETFAMDEDLPVYTILKEASVASSRHFWEGTGEYSFQKNMAAGPCYSDGSLAVEDSYARAGHSNVLFNNLFVIGLIINSAYDVEILKKSAENYNDMLQTFQIAVQDTQRRYNLMSRNHTVYKVNSFMLEFSEQVDETSGKIASKLRRVNITGCYLLPILFKTNGIIEDYLVRYPQSDMVRSFKTVIANRKKKTNGDGDYYWVWDKEGYNAISNYYYVDALVTFYRYYETYERPFIPDEEGRNKLEEMQRKHEQSLEQTKNEYVAQMAKEKRELEDNLRTTEIAPLQESLKKFEMVQSALCEFIIGGIAQSLNKSFNGIIEEWMAKHANDESTGNTLHSRFITSIMSPKEEKNSRDLAALVAWFTKLQLATMFNSKQTFGMESQLTEKLIDDESAILAWTKVWEELMKKRNTDSDTENK